MYFLGKAFKVRGKIHGDEEKPFLDHLEDLRSMVTKVVITLLISTVLCWVFHKQLINVMSKPVHEVWESRQQTKLPEGISIDRWEEVKQIQAVASQLSPEQRTTFYSAFKDENTRLHAEAAGYYAIAMLIPDEGKRKKWIESLPNTTSEHRKLVGELVEMEPASEVNAKSKVVDMKSLKPTETFMLAFKLAFYAGLTISFPLNLWFVLQFVLPGLKANERKVMWPALTVGFGLFLLGACFAYFFVLPRALDFFFSFGTDMGVQNEWRIGEYISFVTQFTLIFGLAFELPVLVMTLVKLGLVGYQTMSNSRTYAVVAIIVTAALITPTGDVLTLSMLAVPMYLLYEFCIVLAYFDYRKEQKREREEYARTGVRAVPEVSSAAGAIAMHDYDELDLENEDEATADDDDQLHHDEDYESDHGYLDDSEHYPDETEEDAISEAEGDEGDADSYQDNMKAQETVRMAAEREEDNSEDEEKERIEDVTESGQSNFNEDILPSEDEEGKTTEKVDEQSDEKSD